MNKKQKILVTLIVGIFIIVGFYLITEAITRYTGFAITEKTIPSKFKSCLREKEITLYVNTENLRETLSKINLVNYLEDVKIFNCLRNNNFCIQKGISNFPSWEIENQIIARDINIEELGRYSSCNLLKSN